MKQKVSNNRYPGCCNNIFDDNEPYDGTEIAEAAKEYGIKIPSEFLCPITLEIMINPFMSKYGFNFERESIFEWIGHNVDGSIAITSCPLTRQPLELRDLVPNKALEDKITMWILLNGLTNRINNRSRGRHHHNIISRLRISITPLTCTVIVVLLFITFFVHYLIEQQQEQEQHRINMNAQAEYYKTKCTSSCGPFGSCQQDLSSECSTSKNGFPNLCPWTCKCNSSKYTGADCNTHAVVIDETKCTSPSCGPFGTCQQDLRGCLTSNSTLTLCPWKCKCNSSQYTGDDCNTLVTICNGPFYNNHGPLYGNPYGNINNNKAMCYNGGTCIIDTYHTTTRMNMTYYSCNCTTSSSPYYKGPLCIFYN